MFPRRLFFVVAAISLAPALTACAGSDDDDDGVDEPAGACGDVSEHDLEIRAPVVDHTGAPLEGIDVRLEDRAWSPGTLGEAVTDGSGIASFTAAGVTDVVDCWGTMLDYVIVAEDPAGFFAAAEDDVNSWLYNAIYDGTFLVEPNPIEMEPGA